MGRSSKRPSKDRVSRSDERRHANRDERRAIRQILIDGVNGKVNLENLATDKKLTKLSSDWEE